jgi:hypothetical protein
VPIPAQSLKSIKMRTCLYLIFFLLSVNLGYGGITGTVKPKHEKVVLKTDSSAVDIRHFDKTALDNYRKKPEFQYKEDNMQDLSLWTRFWRWFWNWLGHLFNFGSKKSITFWTIFWQIVQIGILLLGVAALVFLIFKAQGINLLNMFRRKSTTAPIPYSEFSEDINAIHFDQEIENAIAKANYRFAVRLLYLKCLKILSDAGRIEWQIDKTNNTYIKELSDTEQQAAFKILTRQFEYIWYGEFAIDKDIYKNIDASFSYFNKKAA